MMWKSLEEQSKTKVKQKTQEYTMNRTIKPFKIVQDKDFYYVLKLGKEEFVYTASLENAQKLAQELNEKFYFNKERKERYTGEVQDGHKLKKKDTFAKYDSLFDIQQEKPELYGQITKTFARYAVAARTNGNYMSTLNGTTVKFKTKETTNFINVTGTHIKNGLVYTDGLIYLPYEKKAFGRIASDEALEIFAKATPLIDWSKGNIYPLIKNRQILMELKRLKALAEQGTVGEMNQQIEDEIEILLYGEDLRQRKAILNEALAKLDQMIGLHRFKEDVKRMMLTQKADRKLAAVGIKAVNDGYHTLLLGPAGTGKTELARLFAAILYGLGIIRENKMAELSKEDLVDVHVGGTEEKTKEVIEKAMGGVLFIDEAYMLVKEGENKGNDYGENALGIIMRSMENHRGEFVAVFAGYENEMERLLDSNEGLRSRFNQRFYFEDYSVGELRQIFTYMVKKAGYEMEECDELIERVIKKDMKSGVLIGNARTVRNYVSNLFKHQKLAIAEGEASKIEFISSKVVQKLTVAEQTRDEQTRKAMQEKALAKLQSMIGLADIKKEIQTWTNMMKVFKHKVELGIETDPISLHMAFKGNPGTGKTVIARIIAEILKSNGLIPRGHFKEISRADLVGGYQGQTAEKVVKLFKEMKGGVIFFDEAYSLIQGENDTYGKEAADMLVAEMENNREDTVVIFAGYSKEIDKMFESNAGFASRVPNHFEFTDYDANELFLLFALEMKEQNMKMSQEAAKAMENFIKEKKENGQVDGNGRWIRNQVDKMKKNQSNRLSELDDYSIESLQRFTLEDVQSL